MTSNPVGPGDHIFSFVVSGRRRLLTHSLFVKKLREAIIAIGLNPREFSAHSFRRGGSTFAFSLDMPLLQVKSRGDWKSNCVERYISISGSVAMSSAMLLSAGPASC